MKSKNPRLNGGFGMVSRKLMTDPDISVRDKGVYAYLTTYADSVTNELTVSINKMAAELGITQATVKRSLKTLEDKNIIVRIDNGVMVTRKTILLK